MYGEPWWCLNKKRTVSGWLPYHWRNGHLPHDAATSLTTHMCHDQQWSLRMHVVIILSKWSNSQPTIWLDLKFTRRALCDLWDEGCGDKARGAAECFITAMRPHPECHKSHNARLVFTLRLYNAYYAWAHVWRHHSLWQYRLQIHAQTFDVMITHDVNPLCVRVQCSPVPVKTKLNEGCCCC